MRRRGSCPEWKWFCVSLAVASAAALGAMAVRSGGRSAPVRGAAPRPAVNPRPVYPYSVVPGGAYSAAELAAALGRDPVAAVHYREVRVERLRPVAVEADRRAYVSFRLRNAVYWTRRPVRIWKGETLLADGEYRARGRCGNRISETPRLPTTPEEPPDSAWDNPGYPAREVSMMASGTLSILDISPDIPGLSPAAAGSRSWGRAGSTADFPVAPIPLEPAGGFPLLPPQIPLSPLPPPQPPGVVPVLPPPAPPVFVVPSAPLPRSGYVPEAGPEFPEVFPPETDPPPGGPAYPEPVKPRPAPRPSGPERKQSFETGDKPSPRERPPGDPPPVTPDEEEALYPVPEPAGTSLFGLAGAALLALAARTSKTRRLTPLSPPPKRRRGEAQGQCRTGAKQTAAG